jgi:two-component system phosphate regulon sensor histidine kinase PhoR
VTFRHRVLLVLLSIAALSAVAGFLFSDALARRLVREGTTGRLRHEAGLLAELARSDEGLLPSPGAAPPAATGEPESLPSAFAHRTGAALELRVTVIDAEGRVLGDTDVAPADLGHIENHLNRPEIAAARAGGEGIVQRHSTSVQDDFLYLARRVDRGGVPVGYLRLAVPVRVIEQETRGASSALAGLHLLTLLALTLIGYLAVRRFSAPIEEMSATALAIASGDRAREVAYDSGDEIGQLGSAINRMTRTLGEQIDALSAQTRLRDTILNGMREGLLVVDTRRRILLANRAVGALLDRGLPRGHEGAAPVDGAAPDAGRPLIERVRDQAVLGGFDAALRGEDWRETIRLPREGFADSFYEVTVSPLTDPSGQLVGAIGLFLDVTRLMALEQVRRDFVADASHELRTPLTAIKAFVETLLEGGLDDRENNRGFLEIIRKHSERMEALLDDLTDLSRIETGAVALQRESFECAPLIEEIVESLRPRAPAREVTLSTDAPPGLRIYCDPRRLEQVLINLVDNAIKFNQTGGSVVVRARPAGEATALEVEDTGIGILRADRDKIFTRFFRVDRARSRELGGTGLGLSIVKHLVHLHGGSVQVDSEPGHGSTFRVVWPGPPPVG